MKSYYEFRRFAKEVIMYMNFVKNAKGNCETELFKVLKANCFIMLYNMVESVATSAFSEIYEAYGKLMFDDLIDPVKIIILKNVKKRSPDKLVSSMTKIQEDIIKASFLKKEMFSGNLDAMEFRNIMNKYSITCSGQYKNDDLLTIKTQRNDLSHGIISFTDCGKDFDITDLRKYAYTIILFLNRFLKDVETYLSDEKYKI